MSKTYGLIALFLLPFMLSIALAEAPVVYTNKAMNFQIKQPDGWYVTEADQIAKVLSYKNQHQKIEFLQKMGLIVSITKYPFDSNIDFNPNINISSQKIIFKAHPTKKQFLAYAKRILQSTVPDPDKLDVRDVEINNMIGVQTSYEYQGAGNVKTKNIVALTTIIADINDDNYFIIVASSAANESDETKKMLRDAVESFGKCTT